MNRSSLPIAVALAASAGLLLTACGGGGGSDSSDKIQPSATSTTSTAPTVTTPTPTEAAGPGAPTFDLPSGITVDFKGFDSSDPKTKAALRDATYAAKSILEFEATTYKKETPNFKRYWSGAQGAQYADTIISEGKDGNVITGAYHYYQPIATVLSSGNVSVQYCEDQRKGYLKDPRTNRIFVTTPSLKDFRLWTLAMAKDPVGDWQVYDYKWVKGAKSCQVA